MAKKKGDSPRRKGAGKTWSERKATHQNVQLYRLTVERMNVLAGSKSMAEWFEEALGPTLEDLYLAHVRSLAPQPKQSGPAHLAG